MKMLSPAEESTNIRGYKQARLYAFVTFYLHVKDSASMAMLLSILRSSPNIELVDYVEDTRRIVLRAGPAALPFLKIIIDKYIDSGTFEVKSTSHRRISLEKLKKEMIRYEIHSKRILALFDCSKGYTILEQRREGLLMKFCKKALIPPLPSQVPPSLCSFLVRTDDPVLIYESAHECFKKTINRLL